MNALRSRIRRPSRQPDDRPFFDPWHGSNPVFLYELRVIRAAIRQRESGCLNRIARIVGWLVGGTFAVVGLSALILWIVTSPDPLGILAAVAGVVFLFMWLAQQWQIAGLHGMMSITYTAGAITREREHGTWDLLRITGLGIDRIVLGKLLAGMEAVPSTPFVMACYVGVELLAIITFIALQARVIPPDQALPAGAWAVIILGTLAGLAQFLAAYAAGTALAIAVSAWLRSSGVATAVASASSVVTHFVLPAAAAMFIVLQAMLRWDSRAGDSLPFILVLAYPLGSALVYSLATVGLLRLAVRGAERN
jgi:hypothetical protein